MLLKLIEINITFVFEDKEPSEKKSHYEIIYAVIVRIENEINIGKYQGIVPSLQGSARITGYNRLILDPEDPDVKGFQVI